MEQLERRSFLRAAGALGLGAVAWACSKKTASTSPSTSSNALSVELTGPQQFAVGDTRVAFALFRGPDPIAPSDVVARISPIGGTPTRVPVLEQRVERGSGGSSTAGTQVADIFVIHHDFTAGTWVVDVQTGGKHAQAAFQFLTKVPEPKIGDRAPASQTPTVSDHRGVDPICTRTPPCSMHQISLADALQDGKPTVLLFATPEFCVSRTCGPTTDIVESVSKQYSGRADFIHVEVFRSIAAGQKGESSESQGRGVDANLQTPAFTEWKLATEPYLYFIGTDGIIKDRWTGSVGPDEVKTRVAALIG
jgi:hypothetical protein